MSYNWTHVAGIIRINSPRYIGKNVEDLKKIIGREVSREEAYAALYEGESIAEKTLPYTDHGSLKLSIWENPDENSSAAFTVSVFGDLADHDSPQKIVKWFKKVVGECEDVFTFVGNACIVADNDLNGIRSWVYREDRK